MVKNKRWFLAFSYVFLIYATLPLMRGILNFVRKILGCETFSLFVNFFLFSVLLSVLLIFFKNFFTVKKLLFLFAVLLVFLLFVRKLRLPEERIHFLEYGLCGFLFSYACQTLTGLPAGQAGKTRKIVFAFAFTFAAGILDELIQKVLPMRVFDLRDILFNIVAGAGGIFSERWIFSRT
ncbi:MAG: VanZ family protein [Elusimicrobia bacterium]|nr:VanZ family protein [Elusimicrobiota bacterium]